jgi:D-tyrosyl-tRNA(Tyr) deacylase
MRAVLQRVTSARVVVAGGVVGAIGDGLLVLAAAGAGDSREDVAWTAGKIARLRVFSDAQGRMNRSVAQAGGAILLVPQFTLYGDARRGNRPSFTGAAPPAAGAPLLELLGAMLGEHGLHVERGRFGAHMQVDLTNDGPVTILLDSSRDRAG